MNKQAIIKEVSKYLDDNTYSYALLINGEWGVGKTFL